jgi:hypothetical protein
MSKLKELERRLRDEPDNLGLRVAFAGALDDGGRRDDAVELYRSVAIAYRAQGRTQQAITVCRSVLELAPDDASCQALLAAMLAELGRPPGPPILPPAAPPVLEPPPLPPPIEPEPERDSAPGIAVRSPSSSDLTPLPSPVPYHVAEPTIPPGPHGPPGMRPVPKLTHHDLPPSMRAHLPDELAAASRLEGIARAAHQISASLLASAPDDAAYVRETTHEISQISELGQLGDQPRRRSSPGSVEDTDGGEPIGDEDLLEATGAGESTEAGDITVANDLDPEPDLEVDGDGDDGDGGDDDDDADLETHRQPRVDPHAALEQLGTLRPTMPLTPAARRAAGLAGVPKRPSVARVQLVDDEKTAPRELPNLGRPPAAPPTHAVEPLDSALLALVPPASRLAVLQRFRRRLAVVGTTVIRRGEAGHGLVLVVRGRLDVHSERADGARVSLEAIAPGDYVGEISLLARAPAAAYVVAAIDSELLALAAADFYELLEAFPALRRELGAIAERRSRAHAQRLRV